MTGTSHTLPIARRIKGYFMLFRILPVMVWAFIGSLTGTALAVLEGAPINWTAYLLVTVTAALVQGYPTHIINEIFDWRSGADGKLLSDKKSGGSKVLQANLLSVRELWAIFVISNILLGILIYFFGRIIGWKIVTFFVVPGYLSGLFYTLPPFRFAYRPFLGEWLGGFAGIFLLILGSYFAQTGTMSNFAVLSAAAVALVYIGIMLFFHYLDFENDQLAVPVKNTTVVFLGLNGCRNYVYFCLLVSVVLIGISAAFYHSEVLILLLLTLAVLISHKETELDNALSIIRWGKFITIVTLVVGISFSALVQPVFAFASIPVCLAFGAHKKFGKLTRLR